MRRFAILPVAILLAAPTDAGARATPALRLADHDPVTLVGSKFKPREWVRVTVVVQKTSRSKLVRASATGVFRASFTTLAAPDPCSVTATATGRSGAKAVYRLSERFCPLEGSERLGG